MISFDFCSRKSGSVTRFVSRLAPVWLPSGSRWSYMILLVLHNVVGPIEIRLSKEHEYGTQRQLCMDQSYGTQRQLSKEQDYGAQLGLYIIGREPLVLWGSAQRYRFL